MTEKPDTVLMVMNQEYGAYNPSFALARQLTLSGLRVLYYPCCSMFQKHIHSQGFESLSIPNQYYNIHEKECAEEFIKKNQNQAKEWLNPLQNSLVDNRVKAIFIDPIISYTAAYFITSKIPLISLATNYEHQWKLHVPSSSTSLKPSKFFISKICIAFSWLNLWWKHCVRNNHQRSRVNKVVKCLAHQFELKYRVNLYGLHLALPIEMFLLPKNLDFPNTQIQYYLGICVDFKRTEEDFSFAQLDQKKPIILCSLGTYSSWYPESLKFFQIIIMAFNKCKDWNLIVHIGKSCDPKDLGEISTNVIIAKKIPQLTLLKRASAMITHGGANGIKECIAFGVPMILFPCNWDQPGNVARAVFHGLGIKSDFESLTSDKLILLIKKVLNNPKYRQNINKMKYSVHNSNALKIGVDEIIKVINNQND